MMVSQLRIFAFFMCSLPLFSGFAQDAQIQFINNSADPQLGKLDIYANDKRIVDDLNFHTATPMMNIAAGSATLYVRDSISSTTTVSHAEWDINFEPGKTYIVIISGIVNESKFAANPDMRNTHATFLHVLEPRTKAADSTTVDLVFSHGAPEWAGSDLVFRGEDRILHDIYYGDVSQYLSFEPKRILVDMVHGEDENNRFGTFDVDLRPYEGRSMVVVWSGKEGQPPTSPYALSMIGVLPTGEVVSFPKFEHAVALIQIVHNSPDPDLTTIDLWLNNERIADNMRFREATSMVYVNAERSHNIIVAGQNSTSPSIYKAKISTAFEEGRNYTLFLNGLLNTSGYKPNPDGRSINLGLVQRDETQFTSADLAYTDIAFSNFATDLTRVDFIARDHGPLWQNLVYTGFGGYVEMEPKYTILDMVRSSDPSTVLATFFADMETFAGRAGQAFTSGFADPVANKSGAHLGLFCVFPDGEVVEFPRYIPPTARLQFVHNAPDPELGVIDVYMNGVKLIDDIEYRKGTAFIDIPADKHATFAFAPGNSAGANDAVYSTVFTPLNEQTYFMMLLGVADPTGYKANPDGNDIALQAVVKTGMPVTGVEANKVALNFIAGAMDQGAIGLRTRSEGSLFDGAKFGEFAPMAITTPAFHITEIHQAGDPSDVYGTYNTNFSSFAGRFITLFTSGFVAPDENFNGPTFGLYGVFPDGRVFRYVEYVAPMAQMQFIHNAPDPEVSELDIYVNDLLVADNFAFRKATEFLPIPAGEPVTISIAGFDSAGPDDAIISFSGVFTDRVAYLSMLHGVLDPSQFAVNPDNAEIAFAVDSLPDAKTYASYLTEVEITAVNGSPDLPAIDITERGGAALIGNLQYGKHTGYATYPRINGLYDLNATADPTTVFGNYHIDLSSYGGKSGVLFVSGFFNPEANQDGQPLGLFMAFPDGNVIEFTHEAPKFAQIQFIHNSGDARAETVDIYINDERIVDNLHYLSATPYLQVPAEKEIILAIGEMDSESPDTPLYQTSYILPEGSVHFIMINGVTEPALFAPNPDQISIAMQALHYPDVRLQAEDPSGADFIFVNGITDLPALHFVIKDGNPVFENVIYNQVTDYVSLDIEPYVFDLVLSNNTDSIIARFDGDIVDLKGFATLVFSSGFYSPEQNENGAELTLHAAFPNGAVIPFDMLSIDPNAVAYLPAADGWNLGVAPNPATSATLLRYSIPARTDVRFTVYDLLGRMRFEHHAGSIAPGSYAYPLNLSTLEPGTYMVVMDTQFGVATRKVVVVK